MLREVSLRDDLAQATGYRTQATGRAAAQGGQRALQGVDGLFGGGGPLADAADLAGDGLRTGGGELDVDLLVVERADALQEGVKLARQPVVLGLESYGDGEI